MRSPTVQASLVLGISLFALFSCADSSIGNLLEERLSPDRSLNNSYGLNNDLNYSGKKGSCDTISQGYGVETFPDALCYPGSILLAARQLFGDDTGTVSLEVNQGNDLPRVVLAPGDTLLVEWQVINASTDEIYEFYRNFFEDNNWQITRQPNELNNAGIFQGIKNGSRITVRFSNIPSLDPVNRPFQSEKGEGSPATSSTRVTLPLIDVTRVDTEQGVRYTLLYRPRSLLRPLSSVEQTSETFLEEPKENIEGSRVKWQSETAEENTEDIDTALQIGENEQPVGDENDEGMVEGDFSIKESLLRDIDQAPNELQEYVVDLVALNVIQGLLTKGAQGIASENGEEENLNFFPNDSISRRDYARWLFTLNNFLYGDRPSQQIYLGTKTSQPAFQDVLPLDPDFNVIQGLAEAGLIASSLTSDGASPIFQPDAPMTREFMIAWKVPLDQQGGIPMATIRDIQATWGFQDAEQVDDGTINAIVADYQNGDRSNIRRAFGYTLLLQPKKVVTRAEAAAVLWYFGNDENGVSVQDAH